MENGDLLGDDGLQTPITVSPFTDRVAWADDPLPEYLPGQFSDRRGWWGDLARPDGRDRPIGGRLYTTSSPRDVEGPRLPTSA